MPKGGVTNGIVPPYPMALLCVPTSGFTYETASLSAAAAASEAMAERTRAVIHFIPGNCNCLASHLGLLIPKSQSHWELVFAFFHLSLLAIDSHRFALAIPEPQMRDQNRESRNGEMCPRFFYPVIGQ